MGSIARSVDDDLVALAAIIARLERRIDTLQANSGPADQSRSDPAALARAAFRQRRERAAVFHEISDILGEPAWDILLSLYTAEDPRGLPASNVGHITGVPHSTALRYLTTLADRGLVDSDTIDEDRRCRFVRLSPDARARLTRYLNWASERGRHNAGR